MKSMHYLLLSLLLPVVVFSGLFGVPILAAQPADTPASMSPNEGQGLIITTHGSVWFFRDDVWRYPAFKNFEDSFDFISTVEVEEILEQYSELTLEPRQSMELTFELSQEIEDALIFDLSGTTPDYDGLRLPRRLQIPKGLNIDPTTTLAREASTLINLPLDSTTSDSTQAQGQTFP